LESRAPADRGGAIIRPIWSSRRWPDGLSRPQIGGFGTIDIRSPRIRLGVSGGDR
jgi:hypothetical protein